MLSNSLLYFVLNEWFERDVRPRLKGRSFLIRYADDFVMGFSCEEDARRVMDVLPKRFEKYGLTIHPREDTAGAFRAAQPRPNPADPRTAATSREFRPPGVYALLGSIAEWELGGEAHDVQGAGFVVSYRSYRDGVVSIGVRT
jgi:hypothetical protein